MDYQTFSPDIRERLDSMYRGEPQEGVDARQYPIDSSTRISVESGMDLFSLAMETMASTVVEVGLAYGFSTLYLLEAQRQLGKSNRNHISIDPYQFSSYHGIGYTSAMAVSSHWQMLQMLSSDGLSMLHQKRTKADLVFIDGGHRFDDVLVDFTLSALLVPVDGHIVLDDLFLPSVQKVVQFIVSNRRDFVFEPRRSSNLAIFRRTAIHDEREWDHYKNF